jgi:hypothetical protein
VGNYSKKNINPYDATGGSDPVVVQSMTKNGFNYSSISQINEPVSGSRVGSFNGQGLRSLVSSLSQEKKQWILNR